MASKTVTTRMFFPAKLTFFWSAELVPARGFCVILEGAAPADPGTDHITAPHRRTLPVQTVDDGRA